MNKLELQERQQQEWERYKMSSVLRSTLNDEEEVVHEIKCGTCNGISEEGELHLRECFDNGHEPVCYECMNGRGSDPEQFEDR